jgi:3-hydroxyisobutyrate dehydrogenase
MGYVMASRIARAGYTVHVWNRTKEKCKNLADQVGDKIKIAETPADAIKAADRFLLTMMFDLKSIEDNVLYNKDAIAALKGKTLLQCQSIGPHESEDLCKKFTEMGVEFMETEIYASAEMAAKGIGSMLIGGTKEQGRDQQVHNLLSVICPVRYVGEIPKATQLKLALNIPVTGFVTVYSTALSLVQRCGIDPELFRDLNNIAFPSEFLQKILYPKLVNRDYDNMIWSIDGCTKDTKFQKEIATEHGADVTVLNTLLDMLAKTREKMGGGTCFTSLHEINNPK